MTMSLITPFKLFVSCGLLLTCLQTTSGYTDPTLTPPVIKDTFGNVADENDVITWTSKLPEGKPYYSASEINREDINSGFYENFVDGFTNLVQPTDPPYDLLSDLLQSKLDVSAETMTLVRFGAGIATCFAIGIMFLLIMPLVCCCFCCCRTAGKCGGKLGSRPPALGFGWCTVHTIMVFLVSIVIIAGCVLFFRSGVEMKNGGDKVLNASKFNIRDIETFTDNMVQEIQFLAVDGYKFTAEVLKRDLDNVDYLVGLEVRRGLDNLSNIESHFATLISLGDNASLILGQERRINSSTYAIRDIGADLQSDLDDIRTRFVAINDTSGCNATCKKLINDTSVDINMQVDYNQLPDLTANIRAMEIIEAANLSSLTRQGKEDFEVIPERIKNKTIGQVEDIKNKIDGFTDDISNSLGSVTNLTGSMTTFLDDFTVYIEQANDNFLQYKVYITYASYAVVGVVSLISILQVLGAFGAICCYDVAVEPPNRSTASHQMSNLLMAATGLSFIFSWILMLLVCLLFLVGIVLDRDVCDQLTAPDYPLLKIITDVPDSPLGDGYFLGGMILQNTSIPLTVSGTLNACSRNEAAFTALKLANIINLNEITDYKSLDISSQLADVSVDFTNVDLLSNDTAEVLDAYKNALNIDFDTFTEVLTTDVTKTNFTSLAENIRSVANDGNTVDPAKTDLLAIADELDAIEAGNVTATRQNQSELLEEVEALKGLTDGKNKTIDDLKDGMNLSQIILRDNASSVLDSTLQDFQNRVFWVLDSFVNRTVSGIQEDVGRCLPLYNIWLSVFEGAFCVHFVQPFNGFWFTLGWLVFFLIPSIIFSVKLSKYIRRMQYRKNIIFPEAKKLV